MCIFIHTKNVKSLLACSAGRANNECSLASLLCVFVRLYASVCVSVRLCALTVWSVSGGRTMVFSMVFITSFHSSFSTRFSTVFSQILANKVRLAGGGRQEGVMNKNQLKKANYHLAVVCLCPPVRLHVVCCMMLFTFVSVQTPVKTLKEFNKRY